VSARILTLPLAQLATAAVTAPGWATPARTTTTLIDSDGTVTTCESAPATVATTASPGGLTVAAVVEDYVDGRGPVLVHHRDVYVRVGWDLLTVEQACQLAAAVLGAIETAVEAAEDAGGAR